MATSSQVGADADGRAQLTDATEESQGGISRRSLLAGSMAVGVGAGLGPFAHVASALAETEKPTAAKLNKGDAAILRFLAAAEILETDLWQQYNELGGIQDAEVPGGTGNPTYIKAL